MLRSSELLAFSSMMLFNRSLIIVAILVAARGLPVGSSPLILACPGIASVGRGEAVGAYRDYLNSFSSCCLDFSMSSLNKVSMLACILFYCRFQQINSFGQGFCVVALLSILFRCAVFTGTNSCVLG